MAAGDITPEADPGHHCAAPDNARTFGHGPAIDECRLDEDGHLVAGNDEYSSFVNFCPFCGARAPKGIPAPPPAPKVGPTGSPILEWEVRDVSGFTAVAGFPGVRPEWVADFTCENGAQGFAGAWGDRKPGEQGWVWAYWTTGNEE